MRIGIIGAGIAGLVAANAMQRAGHSVRAYERQRGSSAVGAGLSLFANSFDALAAVDLRDVVEPLTAPTLAGVRDGMRQPSDRWLVELAPGSNSGIRVLHRSVLHARLERELAPGTINFGTEAEADPQGAPRLALRDLGFSAIPNSVASRASADEGLRWLPPR